MPPHHSLMNEDGGGAHRLQLAQHDEGVVEPGRAAISDIRLGDDIDALARLERGPLVDARAAQHVRRAADRECRDLRARP